MPSVPLRALRNAAGDFRSGGTLRSRGVHGGWMPVLPATIVKESP